MRQRTLWQGNETNSEFSNGEVKQGETNDEPDVMLWRGIRHLMKDWAGDSRAVCFMDHYYYETIYY